LPGPRWRLLLRGVAALDVAFRAFARRGAATVVGAALAERYRRAADSASVLEMAVTLLRSEDVVAEPAPRDWTGVVDLLTVGRIEAEKNPLLVVEVLAALERAHPGRYRLRWAGTGPLDGAVLARAAALGVSERLELLGFVPFGPRLVDLYRRAHVFVHVSTTEGVPAVLLEALASGTPVVATDVGGVREAVGGGRAALLVPPSDAAALVAAIRSIEDAEELRTSLVSRGLELARGRTLESQAAAVAAFLARASAGKTPGKAE